MCIFELVNSLRLKGIIFCGTCRVERLVELLALPDIAYDISYHGVDIWLLALHSFQDGRTEVKFVNLLQFSRDLVGNLVVVLLYVVHEILQLLDFFVGEANVHATNPCLDVVVGTFS